MQIITTPRQSMGRTGEYRIDLYADTHLGSRNVDEKLLAKHIQQTKDSGNAWAFLDDAVDAVLPRDKRYDPSNVADWVLSDPRNIIRNQCERWADLFSPIASQCLVAIWGYGTKHYETDNIADPAQGVLDKLGIRRATGAVYLRVLFGRGVDADGKPATKAAPELVLAHGSCGASTPGAKVNYLQAKLSMFPRALGFFCGHGHTKVVCPPHVGLVASGSRMQSVYRRAAMTGGYLLTYAEDTVGYGERKLYQPSALGRITVVLRPFCVDDQRIIEVENV